MIKMQTTHLDQTEPKIEPKIQENGDFEGKIDPYFTAYGVLHIFNRRKSSFFLCNLARSSKKATISRFSV